jgi:methyl-accepting chemotaxis protein
MDAGEKTGVVILQVQGDSLNKIIKSREGMGETGETFIVGQAGGMTALRTDLNILGKGRYLRGMAIDTPYVKRALEGKKGAEVFSPEKGALLMVAYDSLDIAGLHWAIVSKINLEEAITPQFQGETEDFFSTYIKQYGYRNLLLIHPEGRVFYAVHHKADYGTNMISGKFAGSNLGRLLTEKILKTRAFGMADFAPYPPSDHEPSAFMAQPVLNGERIELVVVLELSLSRIDQIMQQRAGMGKTGETYLVGQDHLLRSDSYRDAGTYSVKASFSDPENASIKTRTVEKALAGHSGKEVTRSYDGRSVLAAYTPIRMGDIHWALIAEIEKAEAFSAITALEVLAGIMAVGGVIIIIGIAFYMTRSLTRPIIRDVEFAKSLSSGDFTQTLDIDRKDEIGILAESLSNAASNVRKILQQLGETTRSLTGDSAVLNETSRELIQKAGEMSDRAGDAAGETEKTALSIRSMAVSAEEVSAQVASVASSSNHVSAIMKEIGRATGNVSSRLKSISTSAETMSGSVNTVATSIEEMYASLNEVSRNSGRGAVVTAKASQQAEKTSGIVNHLGGAAKEIGDVVDLIKGIAAQTNLLALNATIEAASAGDAGKGFAVVANEVKDLARQTAKATEDVRTKIEAMQQNTDSAVDAIEQIVTVITEIDDIMSTIASAVEEQTATTNEISKSISETAQAADAVSRDVQEAAESSEETSSSLQEAVTLEVDVSEKLAETAKAAGTIAEDAARASDGTDRVRGNVNGVNEAVQVTVDAASGTKQKAKNLMDLASRLQEIVSRFKM